MGSEVTFAGMGVHTGVKSRLTLCPAPSDSGLKFKRVDLPGQPIIVPTAPRMNGVHRCTRLGTDEVSVSTVEHVVAALRGMEVDNCLLLVDGPEVPILDGSAAEFVQKIQAAGVVEQDSPRRVLQIMEPVWVSQDHKHLVALPSDELRISFTFTNDKKHKALSDQFAEFVVTPAVFAEEIAPARTMGWISEIEELRRRGLIQGGSMDIAVVMSQDAILTPLRFPDELVRHKILDLIGDMGLLGHLHAHIIAVRAGHQINAMLAEKISSSVESYIYSRP